MIFGAFFAAVGQIDDPKFRSVLWTGIGLTLGILAAFSFGVSWLVGWLIGDGITLPLIGTIDWADDLASWSSLVLMLGLSVFLMVPVASAFVSIFLERVAQAVEDRHYPQRAPARRTPLAEAVADGLSFMFVLICANLVALLLYLVFSPFALLIFWGLNGFLLGREYFSLVAMRRLSRAEAKAMRARHMPTIWMAGVLMAIPLSVPILNLVIPILGTATFTHIFHRLKIGQRTSPDR